jgi:hypothetical protein
MDMRSLRMIRYFCSRRELLDNTTTRPDLLSNIERFEKDYAPF